MTLQSPTPMSSDGAALKPGFADPVFDAQAVFRAALVAIAYPGRAIPLDRTFAAPRPLSSATAALCLTLMDFETPAWLDRQTASGEASAWLRFHCGLPLIDDTSTARFAVGTDALNLPHLLEFHPGEIEYPDRSTTLVIQVKSFTDGPVTTWTGPGIKGSATIAIDGLPFWFWSDWDLNSELYPRGVDVIFTCGNALMGLPRTIKVEA
ncbi:carbon-phosphorus lyase [Mesorhizobium tianshanense]|uniref:Alpha-D-ribose 1-methylphosphonate 5-triphosphate synthase subunit PhnH n=1 Tax=Mesorhizobium tianshanense TaxID=39844 RepID=A0A562MQS8_9HYPH|nr:phosphonate C-P lyase system protein PhnH [Mesorhizobium tianshanense]TWI22273.1 alpha-D-ribose 1-methylphosphonate 5-triphosphate synthase subunit PhnH [Mesorhizobium tianshanense]GLS36534.1 carbon-phosphorus lyase [Mesorhizobium tianshanense]